MDRLTAWYVPGNSISVCIKNKEVFSYSSGYANIEEKIPMDPHKIINIYSCSKVLTATAAMQLYEKGFFLLDDPLYDFIPEYRDMYLKNGEKAKNTITMRHLLTMSAGLHYDRTVPAFSKARELTGGKMDTLTTIKCLAEEPLCFEPGEKYQYSFCHDVLAAAVEVISGKKFRDYVKENIYMPLDMQDSYFHNEAVRDRMAEQYILSNTDETDIVKLQSTSNYRTEGNIRKIDKSVGLIFGPEYDSGGAGVITTVADYSKFVSALANQGVGATGERIIAGSTIDLMRTEQIKESVMRTEDTWAQLRGYGYGLGVRTMVDKARSGSPGNYGEFGWGGAAGGTVLADPEIGLSVFYSHHMLNPQEEYYQPRLRNIVYTCINS